MSLHECQNIARRPWHWTVHLIPNFGHWFRWWICILTRFSWVGHRNFLSWCFRATCREPRRIWIHHAPQESKNPNKEHIPNYTHHGHWQAKNTVDPNFRKWKQHRKREICYKNMQFFAPYVCVCVCVQIWLNWLSHVWTNNLSKSENDHKFTSPSQQESKVKKGALVEKSMGLKAKVVNYESSLL